jgi:thiol-disulfide isomerase/thioredoxin
VSGEGAGKAEGDGQGADKADGGGQGAGKGDGERARPIGPEAAGAPPGFLARIGLLLVRPALAFAVASDRRVAGRSGTDLIFLIALVFTATQLRQLVGAAWLGGAIDPGLGFGVATRLLKDALVLDLSFLVLGALALWLGAGPRRDLGRAFDLACVAAIPLFVVDLGVFLVARALDTQLSPAIAWAVAGATWAWSGSLFALAWRPARLAPPTTPPPPRAAVLPARRAGYLVLAVAVLCAALHVVWIARNLELIRPVDDGMEAPAFALPEIGPDGKPAGTFALAKGRVTVLDFWATWCGPCLKALPKLETLAAQHPDVDVIAINIDDPAAARALFDQRGYTRMRLAADGGAVSERYSVSTIPHVVVIDRDGIVRHVARGGLSSVEAAVRAARLRK